MKIETIYSVEDTVFILYDGEIQEKKVREVHTQTYRSGDGSMKTVVKYDLTNYSGAAESRLFKTKQEAANQWLKNNNISLAVGVATEGHLTS